MRDSTYLVMKSIEEDQEPYHTEVEREGGRGREMGRGDGGKRGVGLDT